MVCERAEAILKALPMSAQAAGAQVLDHVSEHAEPKFLLIPLQMGLLSR